MTTPEAITIQLSRLRAAEVAGVTIKALYHDHPIIETYIEHHRAVPTLAPMDLDSRPYLVAILADLAQEVVVQKSVQCGLTEIALARAYTTAIHGRAVLYALPSHPIRNRFVANRVDRQLATVPYYKGHAKKAGETYGVKISDARSLKHIGHGVIHFVGSNTEGEFSEFPADELIVDEQDLCDPMNLGLARDRLAASDYHRVLRISNPRRPFAAHSIGAAYDRSDQKTWHVACPCGHEQVLDWFKHFVSRDDAGAVTLRDPQGRPLCEKCSQPFDRLGPGRWIAADLDARVSGYKISKLFIPYCDPLELYDLYAQSSLNDTLLQIFYGSELGEYYIPKSSGLTMADLSRAVNANLVDWPVPPKGAEIVMGVDVGSVLHAKASYIDRNGRRVAIFIGTLGTFGDLEALADRLGPDVIVIDAHPETHKIAELIAESQHQIIPAIFGSYEQVAPFKLDTRPGGVRVVTANRTAVMDAAYAALAGGEVILPTPAASVGRFFHQMQVPKRIWDEAAAKGAGRFVWSKGEDHYRLADTYEYLAAMLLDRSRVRMRSA